MISDLRCLHGLLIAAAGTLFFATLLAFWKMRVRHAEVKHVFLTILAAAAFYMVACEVFPHKRLIPLPELDFVSTPIEDVELKIRAVSARSIGASIAVFAAGLFSYYLCGLTTERGILKMDEVIGARNGLLGEKELNHAPHHAVPKAQIRFWLLLALLPILLGFVLLWPQSWLLTFSVTVCDFNGLVLASDHIIWSVLAFVVGKTVSTFIRYLTQPTYLISSSVHVWTNFCWLYGSGLLACAWVFWVLAHDVLMLFIYKATMLTQTQQSLDSIVVDGVSKGFNVVTGPLADVLLNDVFSRRTPVGNALDELLHTQLLLYVKVVDDSMWIILLWAVVIFPFFKGVVMYYTWRTKTA